MNINHTSSFKYLLRLLKGRDYHSQELLRRMKIRDFNSLEMQESLTYFTKLGAIDDKRFIDNSISNLMVSGYSKLIIQCKLSSKGYETSLDQIAEVFSHNNYSESSQIESLTTKFLAKQANPASEKVQPKLLRLLQSRGHLTDEFHDA